MMTALYFIGVYGWFLGMIVYAELDHRQRNKSYTNTGVRL